MQEDLKKKFILLSKVAKEKKFAQEYLGLLARRGDLGSIRIGKRWYTTEQWVEEFRSDSERRKEAIAKSLAKPIARVESVKSLENEEVRIAVGVKTATENGTGLKVDFKKQVDNFAKVTKQEQEKSGAAVKTKDYTPPFAIKINNRKKTVETKIPLPARSSSFFAPANSESQYLKKETDKKINIRQSAFEAGRIRVKPSLWEKERLAEKPKIGISLNVVSRSSAPMNRDKKTTDLPRAEKFARYQKIRRPNFAGEAAEKTDPLPGRLRFANFGRGLAFSFSAVLLLVLIFQVGLLFKNDLKKFAGIETGVVAGATDSKNSNVSLIRYPAGGFFKKQSATLKESISMSRALLRASVERNAHTGEEADESIAASSENSQSGSKK